MLPLYIDRESSVHALPAALKLAAVTAASIGIFAVPSLWFQVLVLAAAAALYPMAQLPMRAIARALKPVALLLAIICGLQFAAAGPWAAALTGLRILSLVLLAALVTLTTPFSEMIAVFTALAQPLRRAGVNHHRVGLALALAIRFIPVLLKDFQEIERARAARGARVPALMAAGPLLIKALRMAGTLGDAIEARSFDNRK